MMRLLEGLHHRIYRWIARKTSRKGDSQDWEWDSVDTALETMGLWTIRGYVRRL